MPIGHDNVTAFLTHNQELYRFGPGDRCSQTFDLTFDLSVFDLFMALGSGACLYTMGPSELLAPAEFVSHHGLSVWFSVPAVAALQLQRGALHAGGMPSLRTSLFCGEALTVDVADAWAAAAPNSVAENLYGPTELTIACTRHRFSSGRSNVDESAPADVESGGLVPIGRAFPHMNAIVVDGRNQPVEVGVEGELCLTGPQRFAGYWRAPHLTRSRTVSIDGIDYYRTGDRVVDDGDRLHFLGRFDDQVQVMGHRVELGEIEAAARSLPEVIDAIAVPLPFGVAPVTGVGLAVTVVDDRGNAAPQAEAEAIRDRRRRLRREVAELLPSYMAPRRIDIFDRFPLNANGKIDRRRVGEQAFGAPSPVG